MPSNPLLHFITKVIDIEKIKVVDYHFITDNEILIELKNKQSKSKCPHCKKETEKIHQNHWYRVRDIPMMGYEVFLKVNRRQFKCESCKKVFSEELGFVKKRRTYTIRLAEKVIKEVLETNVESAARRNRMTPAEIETLKIKNKRKRTKILEGLTHSKYPLLKKKESLSDEEKIKIEEVKEVAPSLGEMYQIKEEIREIFESHISSDEAFYKLVEWTEKAYKYFHKSCQTISRWIEEILNYFDNRTTQGVVEGINQKIKLIKRRAYGLTNFDNFRRRILLNWHFSY